MNIEKLIEKYEREAESHKRYVEFYRHNSSCRDMFDIQNALYNQCMRIVNDLKKIIQ